ncbi:MAG: hypothetical protein ACP5HP_02110 [Thermogladius sp.]
MSRRFATEAGYWEVGTRYADNAYEMEVASFHQPVSIPVTFYIDREWLQRSNKPVCITVGLNTLIVLRVRYGRDLIETPWAMEFRDRKFEELGKPSQQSVVSINNKQFYTLKATVAVSATELVDQNVIRGRMRAYGAESWEFKEVNILLTWVDCEGKKPLNGDARVAVRLKAASEGGGGQPGGGSGRQPRNEISPPQGGISINVTPQSGSYYVSTLPGGVFAVGVSASGGEPELSFAIGVGLSEEQARRGAVEVDLVDARTGARLRKVKARNVRLRFRLPPALPAPVYIYLEPRAGGMPISARIWSFS